MAGVRARPLIPSDERIVEILRHPEVYPLLADDFSPLREEFTPKPGFYLEPVEGVLVEFVPMFASIWQAHIAALPEARGRGAEAVVAAAAWLREHTQVRQVLAVFPEGSPAKSLCERTGFEELGSVGDAFLRGGRWLPLRFYTLRIR